MKETYKAPELDVIYFDTMDVIVTSGAGDDDPIETPDIPLFMEIEE